MNRRILSLILMMALFMARLPLFRGHLCLNLGLIAWSKSVLENAPMHVAVDYLDRAECTSSGSRHWTLGSAYWLVGERGSAKQVWNSENAGRRIIQVARYFSDSGVKDKADRWLKMAEDNKLCRVDIWFHRALQSEADKEWMTALNQYSKTLEFPVMGCDQYGHSVALYRMAEIYRKHINPPNRERALILYRKAVEIDDFADDFFLADAYYKIATILYNKGTEYDQEVIWVLKQALSTWGRHSWANLLMGRAIYRHSKDFSFSEHYLKLALELDSSQNWHFAYYLAILYEKEGYLNKAISYYQQALDLFPKNDQVAEKLAELEKISTP